VKDDAPFIVETSDDPLDLFSTSPTFLRTCAAFSLSDRCTFGAPFFAFQRGGLRYGVVQGCCNHWECPRCGIMVAKQHYGRIVQGAREVAEKHDLWFITITCRGKELTEDEATKNYLSWTSRFLDSAYQSAKRKGAAWYYVQVTEKQKRGHPHSHILTSFAPSDLVEGNKTDWRKDNTGRLVCETVSALRSAWLQRAVISARLGDQYDISAVRTVEGASRYVAKYMFKSAQFASHYPKGWKRVRYSQSWPKLATKKTDAFVLLSSDDWHKLAQRAAVVDAAAGDAFDTASFYLHNSDTLVVQTREEIKDRVNKNS